MAPAARGAGDDTPGVWPGGWQTPGPLMANKERERGVPRHSWLGCAVWLCVLGLGFWLPPATPGCSDGVYVLVCTVCLYLGFSWLGFVVCGLGVVWHLFLCRGLLQVVRAARVCGGRWLLLLGICPCALVLAGGVPL